MSILGSRARQEESERHVMKLTVLPPMQCDKGCGDCCTLAPCTEREYQQIVSYAREHGIEPKEQGLQCPFYQEGECKVYPVRPLICQAYGHLEGLECTRGYNVNLIGGAARKMDDKLRKNMPTRHTHEFLGDRWFEIVEQGFKEKKVELSHL